MIQITRLIARQLRSIVKRAFNRHLPVLTFRSGDEGLFIEVQGVNFALQYHDPRPQDREHLLLPLNVLEDVQGSKAEPVYLNTRRPGVLGASWQDRDVVRDLEYDAPEPVADAKPFPPLPAKFTENPPEFLIALRDAYETTDFESKRYALGSIQVRGKEGVIAATDGRQLLKQSGYQFGFEEVLLLEHTKFFGSRDLPDDQTVRVGKSDDKTVAFQIGHWTIWLGVAEGRFPDIDQMIPSTFSSKATLRLSPADARYLVDNLHRMPNGHTHREITLDLNGTVALRSTSLSTPRPLEMTLRNSSKQGDDLRVCTDRTFLARAAEMGFSEIHLPDSVSPALARDATRSYLWMLLDPKEAIKPTDDCLRIESPLDYNHRVTPPRIPQKENPVNRIATTSSAPSGQSQVAPATSALSEQVARRRKRTSSTGKATSSLEQAISLRDQLRDAFMSSKELIRSIKTEKRSQKSLKLALASLKQLQNVA